MIVGVDGCSGGWIAVVLDKVRCQTLLYRSFGELWAGCRSASLVLVDVPIGLRARDPAERLCDRTARQKLGQPRASSVFPAPCRPALSAASYEEASRVNEECTGRRLSRQSYEIMGKIGEVDDVLRDDPAARTTVREIHPEVCFWEIAGRPMAHRKATAEGAKERLAELKKVWAGVEEDVAVALRLHRRRDVERDDVLDAMVGMVTAVGDAAGLLTLPDAPEADEHGLRMEMVYRTAFTPAVTTPAS